MKKILVIALAVVMLVSVFALTACGAQVYTGECHYDSYGHIYGVKVDVAVSGGVIKSVKFNTEGTDEWVRTSDPYGDWTQENHDAAEAAYEAFLNKFVGKTVEEVNAIVATATAEGQSVTTEGWKIAGATQSAARIIVAIQNALDQIK